jgi:hypothetical protein
MRLQRRTFMGLGLAGLGALALPRRATAAGAKNLIVVFARGAWDPVWHIDPQDPVNKDIDSPVGVVQPFKNGIEVLTAAERPNIAAFFTGWSGSCAVVRGINVGSIAHFPSHVRMMTGTRTELSPDLGSMVAATLGDGLPLPYADIGGGAYAGPFAANMGRLGSHNQVVTLIDRLKKSYKPGPTKSSSDTWPPLIPSTSEAQQIRDYVEARAAEAAKQRGALGDNSRRLGDYVDCFQRADDLRAIPELQALKLAGSSALSGQIDLAITMLAKSSCAVYLDSGQEWDTHTDIADQGTSADALFGDLTLLMQKLEAAGRLDDTTVVVMSEMGRTPKLNAPLPLGGKDHWPVTSAMVLGAGVKPGVYGGTDASLNGRNVNLSTGKADDKSPEPLRYDNFAAGVLQIVGVDPKEWLPDAPPITGFIA